MPCSPAGCTGLPRSSRRQVGAPLSKAGSGPEGDISRWTGSVGVDISFIKQKTRPLEFRSLFLLCFHVTYFLEGTTELGEFANSHSEVHSRVDQTVENYSPYCARYMAGVCFRSGCCRRGSWSRQPGLGWRSKKA